MAKTWNDIANEVEKDYLDRYSRVPKSERVKRGIEPGSDSNAYDKRQWVQVYVQMLAGKDKCRELHAELTPPAMKENSAGNKIKRVK